jgi:hypothetical protein
VDNYFVSTFLNGDHFELDPSVIDADVLDTVLASVGHGRFSDADERNET